MITAMPYRLWIAVAGFGLMAVGALLVWLSESDRVEAVGAGVLFVGVVLAALVVPD